MQKDDFIVYEIMRGECFRFLAACFYLPQTKILGADGVLANLTHNLQYISPAAAPFARQMEENISRYTDEELAVEYARLFVGPFGLKAPPYGSIYLDNEHTVMGPSTMNTIQLYEQEGLARDDGFSELPDHIAVELEFMYFLIFRETEALQKEESEKAQEYRKKQDDFRTLFLDKWIPSFCGNILAETDNDFYMALAGCLTALISSESEAGLNAFQQ